jgi:hypothetical protein
MSALRLDLGPTHQIAFRNDTQKLSGMVDDRNRANSILYESVRHSLNRKIRKYRNDTGPHDVARFHCSFPWLGAPILAYLPSGRVDLSQLRKSPRAWGMKQAAIPRNLWLLRRLG